MKEYLFISSEFLKDVALVIIRVGLGAIFAKHGFGKLMGGYATWSWIGSQMSHFGITLMPWAWGLAASCTEFFGGLCLALGLGTRLAACLLSFVMFVALVYHLQNGDAFQVYAHPLSLLIVFVALVVAGGGQFSLDSWLR